MGGNGGYPKYGWSAFMITDRVEQQLNLVQGRGGNQPHNNMPPYYALAYIMKI